MIAIFYIVTKEGEWNIVEGGRIDSQSNKNKNIVMESKVFLMIFQDPIKKDNTYDIGDGGISRYDGGAFHIYKGRWMEYSFIIRLKTIQLHPTPIPFYPIYPAPLYPSHSTPPLSRYTLSTPFYHI